MSRASGRWVGRRLARREDPRLLAGLGCYLPDLVLPGMVHLAFVRAPHAHAALVRVDVTRARAAPGVVGVFTAADLDLAPIAPEFAGEGYHTAGWPPLATTRVRFAGEPVAVVAAADRYLAEDAAELVQVDYEVLPAVASVEAAMTPGAPPVHDGVPGNCYFRREHRQGDVEGLFAQAPVVVRGEFRHQRVTGAPMEGRGIAAQWDARGRLVVWASTQVPHLLRTALARSLRLPEAAVRVLVPDVGGGFGPKMHAYPEDVVTCAVARRLGRPARWVEDRRENLLATTQAREQVIAAEAAADSDGRLLALRARIICDSGAYSVFPLTAVLEPMGSAQIMPGPYHLQAYAYTTMAIATTKAPVGAYRGVGMAVGVFVMERLMDKLAAAVGLDPAEVRRRNFVPPERFPYTAPTGLVYDSGRFAETLRVALAAFGYDEARREQARLRAAGRSVGVGLAAFVEYTGMGPQTFARRGMRDVPGHDGAAVAVDATGGVRVAVSCPSQGQGHETVYAQLVADALGVDPAVVVVTSPDTDAVPAGSGTFASRAVVSGGGALLRAAARVREKAVQVAAHLLEAAPGDVVASDGRFHVRGTPERSVAWAEVARAAAAPAHHGLPAGLDAGLAAEATYDPPPAAFGNGVHVALVDVDRATGQARVLRYAIAADCGPLVNPVLVDGQTRGGLAQGLGEALLEEIRYDASGQPLVTTLMDYLLPTAAEMPAVVITHLETPSPITVGGFKGMGESATIGSPACLANAVSDALGTEVDALPLTPDRLRAAGGAPAGFQHR
ncbi:MAG: xanthine dehydrogenase family protein molybdopterin-binding subunit [Armatimonadota bacterium]|nr:xanthine dehydrogenase family protein molybdopterin-binding subunit [Armatimonadota bacterium]MDR7531881.1 xanthine dehydrogenase family protein molybdopterin-binding subunit [Armatimonadota bacterium]MDR7534774.1 xanthine dehydrogenase family protein molybdopterin-binding subunit [Armatimonadota bacterium]